MIISTLLKVAFIYSAFVLVRSLLRSFLNSKIEKVQKQAYTRSTSNSDPYSSKKKDYAKSGGKVVDAEYKVLKD